MGAGFISGCGGNLEGGQGGAGDSFVKLIVNLSNITPTTETINNKEYKKFTFAKTNLSFKTVTPLGDEETIAVDDALIYNLLPISNNNEDKGLYVSYNGTTFSGYVLAQESTLTTVTFMFTYYIILTQTSVVWKNYVDMVFNSGCATLPETETERYEVISNNASLSIDLRSGRCENDLGVMVRKAGTYTYLYDSDISNLLNKGFFQLSRLGGSDTSGYYCPFITSWSIRDGSGIYLKFRVSIKNAMFWKQTNTDGFYVGGNYPWSWNGTNNTTISVNLNSKIIAEILYIKNSLNFPQASARSYFSGFQTVPRYNYTGCHVVGMYNSRSVSFDSVITPPKSSYAQATNAIACWCEGCGWIDNGSFAKFERCYIDSNNVMQVGVQVYQPASDSYTSVWIPLDSYTLYEKY